MPEVKITRCAIVLLWATLNLMSCSVEEVNRFHSEDQNPKSGRVAILEDNGTSCWLYLTAPRERELEKGCLVYSAVEPTSTLNVEALGHSGETPMLSREFASGTAIISGAKAENFTFEWSQDGDSVCVVYRGNPKTMLVGESEDGFSKAIAKEGLFGKPWDQSVYTQTFSTTR
tara:strand:- start:1775 stop:2293 length:519 start_codon:yes stop_codon:yes gene_type:complete